MVERRSPKTNVWGSSPSWPAIFGIKRDKQIMKKLITYYKMSREELLKVIFPLKEQVRNAFISVVVVVSVVALFLALVDFILGSFVSSIL